MNTLGLYLHIPFCLKKCSYCDFYSISDMSIMDDYVNSLTEAINFYKDKSKTVDTIYFGGGTPSLLKPQHIEKILNSVEKSFNIVSCETTIEANPCTVDENHLKDIFNLGVNRLSIGVQSLNDFELKALGRLHDSLGAIQTIKLAQKAGFSNISADLMMGIPNQTQKSLFDSIDGLNNLGVTHISSYMLKIEEGTPFFKNRSSLSLPNDDEVANFYLSAVEKLESLGFEQYEISNFAKKGFESRHNLKYWVLDDYLGLGPAAHSFYNGKRFYFERDISKFIKMANDKNFTPNFESEVDLKQEYIMLSLRLTKGLSLKRALELGIDVDMILRKAQKFIDMSFMKLDGDRLYFTKEGFLVSNTILSSII